MVTVKQAAKRVGKSAGTIRRWVREGHVQGHPGPPPAHGGSPHTLVDVAEVVAHAAQLGAPSTTTEPSQPVVVDQAGELRLELVKSQAAVVEAQLRGEIAALTARLESREREAMQARGALEDARAERDRYRELMQARDAELAALRSQGWWSRVLGLLPDRGE